nr:MAG TPA: hypothetical protein [Caudoviricetes sp.]
MLYAWGAWLIFFFRKKNGGYNETQTTRKD